jgi:hypothetical protein
MTPQNIKEQLNKDMENLRKKTQTEVLEIKIPLVKQKHSGRHSSRLKQVEDRISELEGKMEIKEKKQKKS